MAFRVIGYDGASYHEQSMDYDNRYREAKKKREEAGDGEGKSETVKVEFTPVPVWSYVLYFGVTPWDASKNLSGIFDLTRYPQQLQDDFRDYGYTVIQVAFSTEDEINALQSDFKYVAKALVAYRELCEKRGVNVRDLDLSKLKQALDGEMEYPIDVSNLIMAILQSSNFGKAVEIRLKEEGGCKMYDYVEAYAKNYATNEKAQMFWKHVYIMMSKGLTENAALNLLDSEGKDRIKYPRPANFPKCFAATA